MKELSGEERYRVWLYDALNGSSARMSELIASYGCAGEIFSLAQKDQITLADKSGSVAAKKLHFAANEARIGALLRAYGAAGIEALSRISENYPSLLREIYDPPEMLFIKGRLHNDIALPIAVIGARKCSSYGKETAESLSCELAGAGACVVSGLAYGIDAAAARGALKSESDYPTIAVLGCGVDIVYPQSSLKEYNEIAERGCLISEFLPGTPPRPGNFPQRNRIISGMSRATLVIEAGERSGTSITVDFALEQGRDVFAVPGRINDALSMGTNAYIRDGYAKAVLSAKDVLCEYGIEARISHKNKADISSLPQEQQLIYRLLEAGEKNFDELCVLTSFTASSLNSVLTVMEFSGIIRQMSGRMYKL